MRLRLPDRAEFNYQVLRDNRTWRDHVLRTNITGALLAWTADGGSVIDPACGDGSIVMAAHRTHGLDRVVLGDISIPNYTHVLGVRKLDSDAIFLPLTTTIVHGDLEQTLASPEHFDVVVLTEILEHVEDPVGILRLAHERADRLIASSPIFEVADGQVDSNPEHLWQFDQAGYDEMLREAGWQPKTFVPIHFADFYYDFQLWGAA